VLLRSEPPSPALPRGRGSAGHRPTVVLGWAHGAHPGGTSPDTVPEQVMGAGGAVGPVDLTAPHSPGCFPSSSAAEFPSFSGAAAGRNMLLGIITSGVVTCRKGGKDVGRRKMEENILNLFSGKIRHQYCKVRGVTFHSSLEIHVY